MLLFCINDAGVTICLIIIITLSTIIFCYFFIGKTPIAKNITWGVDFSQSQAEYLKLNWKEVYLAMINDLKVKNIKLHTNWNWVEGIKDDFYFSDIDWQIKKAEENNVKIIYVLGLKTGRWPECHIPNWAQNLSEQEQQSELLKYVTQVVARYKGSKAIAFWQVENEPLFKFGECPVWYYRNSDFLKKEVALVKSLDPSRQILISDSGEQSMWFKVAEIGDIVGTTLYRSAWAELGRVISFEAKSFLNSQFYAKKSDLVKKIFNKNIICVELQAEPWISKPLMESSIEKQLKSMNHNIFISNIEFAKQTGFDTFYFWGVEWWYWMKTVQNQPQIWNEAKSLF